MRLQRAIRTHAAQVWRVVRRAGLSERDADEAAQDVFLVLAKRLHEVPPAAERSFLVATALRRASDGRKAAARHRYEPLDREPASTAASGEELIGMRQARRLLDEALESLSEEQRSVFVLVELEELTGPEAAEVLGVPLGTVASRLRTARLGFDKVVRRLHQQKLAREGT